MDTRAAWAGVKPVMIMITNTINAGKQSCFTSRERGTADRAGACLADGPAAPYADVMPARPPAPRSLLHLSACLPGSARRGWCLLVVLSFATGCGVSDGPPFLTEVVAVTLGAGAGFGEEENVLGPPEGAGLSNGSLHVLSLGAGGSVVAKLGTPAVDGEGVDLIVFENPFNFIGGLFREPGEVSVSEDGETWHTFSCDAAGEELLGCAGQEPVYSHPDNDLDPRDPVEAGGDGYDLAALGLTQVQFVRIVDQLSEPNSEGQNAGFDLDAVAAVHTLFDDDR